MCLLTYLPPGAMPELEALHYGALLNDDGHGFAVVADQRIIVERDLDADRLITTFHATRTAYPDGPAMFHSRLCTHGQPSLDNCHPFPVGGDHRTVIAHNGILPMSVRPAKGDPRSDTRITAEQFLPTLGSLRYRRVRLRFERWMRPGNKAVVLTVDRRFRKRAYLFNENAGVWDDGVWYSNDGYLPAPAAPWRWDSRLWDWLNGDEDWPPQRCHSCGGFVYPTDHNCRECGACLDCEAPIGLCMCYSPGRHHQRGNETAAPST